VLCALGWGPGQELTLHSIDDMIVIRSARTNADTNPPFIAVRTVARSAGRP
jgi:hypothetical protein